MREDNQTMKLSKRQEQVIGLTAKGLTGKEIADRLGISTRTVETHLEKTRYKLQARTQAHAVANWLGRLAVIPRA